MTAIHVILHALCLALAVTALWSGAIGLACFFAMPAIVSLGVGTGIPAIDRRLSL